MIGAVVFLTVIFGMNRLIVSSVDKMDKASFGQDRKESGGLRARVLIPEDPVKYHILAVRSYDSLVDQGRWDSTVRKSFEQSGAINHIKQSGAFNGRKKTPQEFRRQLQTIEKQIKSYEAIVKRSPQDLESAQALHNLYMIRATLLSLEDTVVQERKKK